MNKSIHINQEILFQTISDVAKAIENELASINETGIFFVPELHFAFEVGKAIYQRRQEIFGVEKIDWLRETNLGNGGPSDLVFKIHETFVVIEFKISGKSYDYKRDIEKLQRLSKIPNFKGHRYFVALVDTFPKKKDGRLEYLKNADLSSIGQESIRVSYSKYVQTVICELVCYHIKP